MTSTSAVLENTAAYAEAEQTATRAAAACCGRGDSALDVVAYDRLVRAVEGYEQAHPDEVPPATFEVRGAARRPGEAASITKSSTSLGRRANSATASPSSIRNSIGLCNRRGVPLSLPLGMKKTAPSRSSVE